MTSGNESETPSVMGSAPQNGENKPPQAIVKPQVLTHVIEGFVIQEGAEPFPVCVSVQSLLQWKHDVINYPRAGVLENKCLQAAVSGNTPTQCYYQS